MVNSDLSHAVPSKLRPRVCAVSYLNTIPLVWGALHGPQRSEIDLTFAVPSICADRVAGGMADVGIIPVIEMARHGFSAVPGVGIASRGPVRSILLVSKVPFDRIQTLAGDAGSRSSVQLARVILQRRFGVTPAVFSSEPDLVKMLNSADAALLIGDAALSIDPAELDYPCLDLGEEWTSLTGLPMVFAMWAGRETAVTPRLGRLLQDSCDFGLANLDRIIPEEAERRGFPEWLVHHYLTRHIVFHLGEEEERGLKTYLAYVRELDALELTEIRAHDDATASR